MNPAKISAQYLTAVAICIGFGLVALAIFFSGYNVRSLPLLGLITGDTGTVSIERAQGGDRLVYGNPKAGTTIVEFSDFQCPFCSQLHGTLAQIVDQSNGTINWEYRHFPLPIHENAPRAALAAECIAELKGHEKFFDFAKVLMESQDSLTKEFLASKAQEFGISETDFLACVDSQRTKDAVSKDSQVARSLGGNGTPFSVIEFKDGTTKSVSGALPLAQWESFLNI